MSRTQPRAETVGSLLRSAEVVRAASGELTAEAAARVLDQAVLAAIRLQEDAGLDVITDGEVRRTAWAQTPRFLDCFEPTPGRGLLDWRGGPAAGSGLAVADAGDKGAGGERVGGNQAGDNRAGDDRLAGYQAGDNRAGDGRAAGNQAGDDRAGDGRAVGNQAGDNRAGGKQAGVDQAAGYRAGGYPAVVRRVTDAPRTGDVSAEYAFLAQHARARTKFTLPAPSYHRRYWSPEHSTRAYRDCEEFLTDMRDFQRNVVEDLIMLGCDYIQLDAPNYGSLCDPDMRARMAASGRDAEAEMAFDADLDSSLFDGIRGVTTALHICRGNGPGGTWHSTGGYGAISGPLFPRLAFDRLLLEYDSDRAGDFSPLGDVRPGTVAVLGLLTTKSAALDSSADIEARIAEAARVKPLAELAISTQCGFASVPRDNPVTAAAQQAKLELVASIARRAWPD